MPAPQAPVKIPAWPANGSRGKQAAGIARRLYTASELYNPEITSIPET